MAPQEAIMIIKIAISEVKWNFSMNYAVAFETAIEALEKQIPKSPLDITMEYNGDYGKCPCCGTPVSDFYEKRMCRNCGQRLDWK